MLALDPAYADEFWARQDRLDDHCPADEIDARHALGYARRRRDTQVGRAVPVFTAHKNAPAAAGTGPGA